VHSVGVERQYTGTAGRIKNAQVAVFLAYAGSRGRALMDRDVYVPKSWADDRDRCRAAGVPDQFSWPWPRATASHCPSVFCVPIRPPPRLHRRCWNRLFAGKGAKGDRDYDWAPLVMLAHALLAVIAAHERDHRVKADDDLISLTCQRDQAPVAKLIMNAVRTITYWLHWPAWRPRHQQRARTSHYR
jgi:DDE superfamily endonuclease